MTGAAGPTVAAERPLISLTLSAIVVSLSTASAFIRASSESAFHAGTEDPKDSRGRTTAISGSGLIAKPPLRDSPCAGNNTAGRLRFLHRTMHQAARITPACWRLARSLEAQPAIGEAHKLGWCIHPRYAWGRRGAMKTVRGCLGKAEIDLHTLDWTRGAAFPVTSPENRLKYPLCGSRRVSIIFDLPREPNTMRIAGMPSR
jgi:hypothetical protein